MSPPIQLKKVSDEGSTSPFITRIFFGLLSFRDLFLLMGSQGKERQEKQDHFDKQFNPMLEAAQASRDAAVEIISMVDSHTTAINNGTAVRYRENQYEILENIDAQLSQCVDKLIDQSIIATKTGLQWILRDPLGLEIGFFFQQDNFFNQGIADLRMAGEDDLATYLELVRATWHSDLQELRVKHEHKGWSLDQLDYHLVSPSQLQVYPPEILGEPVHEFSRKTANRVLLFIENMMVYAFSCRSSLPINIVEIPLAKRNPLNPERFRIAPKGLDKSTPWTIAFRDDMEFV